MAKILVANGGLKGILLASLALAKRLEADGHEVFCASSIDNEDWANANSVRYIQLPNVFEKNRSLTKAISRRLPKPFSLIWDFGNKARLSRRAYEALKHDQFRTTVGAGEFDLLICDIEFHELILTAHGLDLPTVLLSQWFSLAECRQSPPLNSTSAFEPESDYSQEWTQLKAKNQLRERRSNLSNNAVSRKIALKRLAKELKYPFSNWEEYLWPPPFVYVDVPVISMAMEEMEFPKFSKGSTTYVGPMIDVDRKSPTVDRDFDISHFQHEKEQGKKLIVVTVTSFDDKSCRLVETLNEAAKKHPHWTIVLAPVSAQNLEINTVENFHCFDWIPQLKLLNIADLSVNHGGINTINECIHFRVPMLIFSGGKHDQNGCTTRASFHGVARQGLDPSQIESEIGNALADQKLKDNVSRFRDIYHRYSENDVLERYIRNVLTGSDTR